METWLELFVLVAVCWPVARVALSRPFLRRARAFPAKGAATLGALFLYAALVFGAAAAGPVALRSLTGAAVATWLILRWRSREAFGVSAGLPAGSLVLAPVGPWRDHRFYQKQAALHGPLFKMSNFVRPAVCIVGLDLAADLLREHEEALGVGYVPSSRFVPSGFLRYMPPDPHRLYRGVFQQAFSEEVIDPHLPHIRGGIREELGRLAEESTRDGGARPRPCLQRMVRTSFLRLFFGMLAEEPNGSRLLAIQSMIDWRQAYRHPPWRIRRLHAEVDDLIRHQAREWKNRGGDADSKPPSVLHHWLRSEPELIHDPAAVFNLLYISVAGGGDLADLLVWIVKMLCDHQEWAERVATEGTGADLAGRIVLETLRLEQSEYLVRRALSDIWFREKRIPRGWQIRICVRESHRDAARFEDPEAFNPDRFLDRPSAGSYVPFGMSPHACLGQFLTVAFSRALVEELARGFEWEVVEDGPREYGGFHWRPSSKLSLVLDPRSRR